MPTSAGTPSLSSGCTFGGFGEQHETFYINTHVTTGHEGSPYEQEK